MRASHGHGHEGIFFGLDFAYFVMAERCIKEGAEGDINGGGEKCT